MRGSSPRMTRELLCAAPALQRTARATRCAASGGTAAIPAPLQCEKTAATGNATRHFPVTSQSDDVDCSKRICGQTGDTRMGNTWETLLTPFSPRFIVLTICCVVTVLLT